MAEIDYNEILLEAIDTIVLQRISEVNFDKTIVCTITDDTDRANGHYVVTDGSIKFDAYAENTYYMINDKVYVQIPLNDWSQKKTIIGRYRSNENDTPTTYVPPLDKIINITGNLISTRFSSGNAAANFSGFFTDDGKPFEGSSELIISRKFLNLELQGFDVLGLKANFKSTLDNYLIKSGSYGLRVYLYAKSINGGEEIISLDLNSSKDMFGNAYGYSEFLTQQQAYKLNTYELKKLHLIDVVLYQTGDFQYVNEQGLMVDVPVTQISEDDVLSNIFVENIEVFLGYDITAVPEDQVKIFSTSSEIYDPEDVNTLEKHMNLVWYHKDKNNRYLNFTDGTFGSLKDAKDPNKQVYFIEWQHSLNDGQWETLVSDSNQAEIYITIDNLWAINEYRAIIYFAGGSYISNISTYKLKQGLTSSSVNASLNLALTVHNGRNALDAYPYYGADTALINPVESSVPRHIWFSYESAIGRTFEPDILSGATIQLLIPKISSMLDKPMQEPAREDANFYIYEKQLIDSFTQEDKTFVYRIKPHYNPLFQNNTLILKVIDKNGYEYTTSKTINFSRNGNTGTDYTLIISDKNGRLAAFYSEEDDGNLELVAQLYDANFNLIEDAIIEFDENYYSADDAIAGYPVATAFTSINWLGEQVTLQSKYPVSFAAEDGYIYQGPTTIVYDSQGLHPIYYNGALGLFDKDMNSLNPVWDLEFYDQDGRLCPLEQGEETDYPRIKDNNTIIAPSMFLRDNLYNVVLVAYSESIADGETLWRQPLIILSNNYSSSILNNWDGQVQVSQEGGYILSSAMAIGYKEENAFYGIVLGDVATIDNGNVAGLFGYHEGEQSFGFGIDGQSFIGKSGHGRIEFDGNWCQIRSATFDRGNKIGSSFDLDDGNLYLYGTDHKNLFEFDSNGLNIKINNGLISAQNFNLSAVSENNNTLILNNCAIGNDYQFFVGKNGASYISLDAKGNLTINVDSLLIQNSAVPSFDDIDSAVNDAVQDLDGNAILTAINKGWKGISMIDGQFVLSADYVKTGELNADLITAGALTIKNGTDIILSANTAGSVTIGGWKVGKGYLYTDAYNGYVGLYSDSPSITIAGQTKKDWRIVAGDTNTRNFGVDKNGALYSTSGKIGGWTIGSNTLSSSGLTLGDSTQDYSLQTSDTNLSNFLTSYTDVILSSTGSTAALVSKSFTAKGKILRIYNVQVITIDNELVYYSDPTVSFSGTTATVKSTLKDSGAHQAGIKVRVYYEYEYNTVTKPGFSIAANGEINCRRIDFGPNWKFNYTHFQIEKGQEDYVYLGSEGITLEEQGSVAAAVAWTDIVKIGKGLSGWALISGLGWVCFNSGILVRTINKNTTWQEIINASYFKTGVTNKLSFH